MNAFKTDYVNSQCSNHFSIHTALTVSLATTSRRAGSQLALHPLQRRSVTHGAPHTPARPFEPAVYQRHTPHGTRQFAAHVAQKLTRSPAHGDVSKTISDEIRQPRRAQARCSIVLEYWRWVTVHFGHLAVLTLAPRYIPLVWPLRTRWWRRSRLMAATGHAQRISPSAMARLYTVHYAPSCVCAFKWRSYACWRYCRSRTHERLDRHVSRSNGVRSYGWQICAAGSVKVSPQRVTLTCELVRLAFGNVSAPSVPFSAASSFLRFFAKILRFAS